MDLVIIIIVAILTVAFVLVIKDTTKAKQVLQQKSDEAPHAPTIQRSTVPDENTSIIKEDISTNRKLGAFDKLVTMLKNNTKTNSLIVSRHFFVPDAYKFKIGSITSDYERLSSYHTSICFLYVGINDSCNLMPSWHLWAANDDDQALSSCRDAWLKDFPEIEGPLGILGSDIYDLVNSICEAEQHYGGAWVTIPLFDMKYSEEKLKARL